MERNPKHIETISEYNEMLGLPTVHPMVSVIDLSLSRRLRHMRNTFGFYVVFLKEAMCGDLIYGRSRYDYAEGTVVCLAPGQVIGVEDNGEEFQPRGWALCFHPDFIRGTTLGKHMREYTFFSYEVNEALHLSAEERATFTDCLSRIGSELNSGGDRLSRRLITSNIELLMDYCLRFYERQFDTRHCMNTDLLVRFENLLENYFCSRMPMADGLPTVGWCASELCLSPNYFGDLIKRDTGRTAQEYIQHKVIDTAKEKILSPGCSISQIAYELGFQYPQHFTRLFKKVTGLTPSEYRVGLTAV